MNSAPGEQVHCTWSADLRTKTERSRALILRSRMNSDPWGSGYSVPEVQICSQRRRGPEPWSSGPVWTLPLVGSGYTVPAVQICVQRQRGPGPWSSGPVWTLTPGGAGWPGWFRHPVQPLHLPPHHQPDKILLIKISANSCGNVTIFYGSCYDFWKVTVPVPTFDKIRFRLHILAKKQIKK